MSTEPERSVPRADTASCDCSVAALPRRRRSERSRSSDRAEPAFVRGLASRYAGRGEDLDDLVQVGMVGLIKVVDRFDLTRGVAFTSFATPTVLGEIKRQFRDRMSAVRIPRPVHDVAQRILRERERLAAVLGRATRRRPLGSSDRWGLDRSDGLDRRGDDGFVRSEERMLLEAGLEGLSERQRRIVALYFSLGRTQSAIAAEVGCSQMQVSRPLRKAIESMQQTILTTAEPPVAA